MLYNMPPMTDAELEKVRKDSVSYNAGRSAAFGGHTFYPPSVDRDPIAARNYSIGYVDASNERMERPNPAEGVKQRLGFALEFLRRFDDDNLMYRLERW